MSDHPFEETDAGNYRICQPADGMIPDEMTVVLDGTAYRLQQYVGKDSASKVQPDVLVYEFLTTEER